MKKFESLSEKEYRAYELESYSSLKALLSSPEAFLKQQESPFTGNDFTLLGTAVHNLLQGAEYLMRYAPYEIQKGDPEDLIVVPESFREKLDCIKETLTNHDEVAELLNEARFEVPYIAKYKSLKYKSKLDIVKDGFQCIGEIKTSSKATDLKSFRKEAYSRDYDLQAAMYCHAAKVKQHFFIVVNTVYPYNIAHYPSSDLFLKSGYLKLEKIEKLYKKIFIDKDQEEDDKV